MQSLNFRPDNFETYIGQESIKTNLKIMIAASQKQQLPLKHMIFIGGGGMGKTSLGYLIANLLKQKLHLLHRTNLQKPSDLITCLMQIKSFDLVFIDEIHAISQEASETLYPALEDNCLNLILGKDYNTKNVTLPLPPFTFLAATTLIYQIPQPLLNRFTTVFYFEEYSNFEIQQILNNLFLQVGLALPVDELQLLTSYTRNNPRTILRLFYQLYDYLVVNSRSIDLGFLTEILTNLKVFQDGLEWNEVNYLKHIYHLFQQKPVGLGTLG
ncbi:AAA family ATPase [Spiroplasma endosymbiont of Poecilobothrus nobilitatus]|uniref:AAA family ATPase n=1 Tax=Spiroplasma endosymbiont of Poecilobothrus nobilitatus TaxID=1209220 RepID=UPI00313DCD9F